MPAFKDTSEAVTGFSLENIVVVDTETTGLKAYEDEILSIGICDAFGKVLFKSYIRPTRHSSWPDAQRVHGISPDKVRNAPTIREAAPEIRKHLMGNKLVVGYNTFFDLTFLVKQNAIDDYPCRTFDVMREYASVHGREMRQYGGTYKWSKLKDCAASFGYKFAAHDSTEDAKATAWCFRALMSDERYLKSKLPPMADELRRMPLGQVKAATENVLAFIEDGTAVSDAELRLGKVTRGQNKGADRYECFVSDKCVGVSSKDDVEKVRTYYFVGEQDELPKTIPCKARMSASGNRAMCSATIADDGFFERRLLSMAEQERNANSFGHRNVAPSKRPASKKQQPPSVSVGKPIAQPIPSHAARHSRKKRRVIPWVVLSAFLVLCALTGLTEAGQGDLLAWAITELLFAGGAYLSARKAVSNRRLNDLAK